MKSKQKKLLHKCVFDDSRGLLISNPPQEYCSRIGCDNKWVHGSPAPICKIQLQQSNPMNNPNPDTSKSDELKDLRDDIESLCYSAGSYEDYDNDGWPIQSSLEDGLLKEEVDNIIKQFNSHIRKRISSEIQSILKDIEAEMPKGLDVRESDESADFQAGYNQAIEELTKIYTGGEK